MNKKLLLSIALWIAAASSLAQGFRAGDAQKVLDVDFEHDQRELTEQNVVLGKPAADDSLVIDCTQARSGRCSMRALIRPSSNYVSFGKLRAEADAMKAMRARYQSGDRFSYDFSLLLGKDWEFRPADETTIVWQFKRTSSQPDAFVAIKGTRLILRLGDSASAVIIPSLEKNVWMDLSMEVTWSAGSKGMFRVRVVDAAGELLGEASHPGANMRSTPNSIGYLKWGLYMPNYSQVDHPVAPSVLWYDRIRAFRIH